MSAHKAIRIVKRAERELRQEYARRGERAVSVGQGKQDAPSDAVMTVTKWIGELRQKKRAEAMAARTLKGLFTEVA